MDNSNQEVVVPFGPNQPLVTIGRATDCVIRSNRRSVSRHHAEFRYHNGQYEVVDLGSANGTYLIINENRQRIEGRLSLSHSDEVWCGDFILYFEEEDDYYEPVPYEPELDADPTYGDHNPVMSYDDPGGYQNPPMYDAPAQPNWNAKNPGAAPFASEPPPPAYQPNANGQFGSEPYQNSADHYAPEPYQSPSGNYGAEPYTPSPDDYYEEPEPQVGQALYSTSAPPAAPPGGYQPDPPAHHAPVHPPAPVGPSQQEFNALQERLDQLQINLETGHRERDQLKKELERAQAAPAPVVDDGQVNDLQAEIARLNEQVRVANESANADEAIKAQNAELERQLKESQERIEGYRRRITLAEEEATRAARLRDDLRDREKDIEQLRTELDRNREEVRQARDEARKARESAERARSSLQTAERNVQEGLDIKKELDRHKRLLDEIERRNRDLSQEFSELETLSKELEQELEKKTGEAESLKTLANNHEKRLTELSSDGSRAVQDLKKTRIALDEALHKSERFEVMSQQLGQELEALKTSSSTEIEALTKKLDHSSKKSTVALAKLTNQHDRLVEERDNLREQLDGFEPEMRALKSEIEGLKQRLRMEKNRTRQENSSSKELEALQAEHAELKSTLVLAEESQDALRATVKTLEEQLQAAQDAPQSKQADPAELAQLREHNDSLRERLQKMELHFDEGGAQDTMNVPALRENSTAAYAHAGQVLELLDSLERVIDAVSRTDFSVLGTVDRIRIQSAFRDTDPTEALGQARRLLRES